MEKESKSFWKLFCTSTFITCFRTVCSFCLHKFLAVVFGPSTFALVGQFQNFISVGQGVSSLALQNGWVSLSARYKNDERLAGIWRGGFRLSVFAMFAFMALAVIFTFLAPLEEMFPGIPRRGIQAAILFALPGIAVSNFVAICLSVLNGLGLYYRYVALALSVSLLQTLWVVILVYTKSLSLLSVIATQSLLTIAVALPIASRAGFSLSQLKTKSALHFENRKIWIPFIAMGLIPMLLTPISLTFIRQMLHVTQGLEIAGLWQGVSKISDFFNVAVSSILGIILLPKISESMSEESFKKTFYPLLIRILGISGFAALVLFFLRDEVVYLFLSEKFAAASPLLSFQLLGDFLHAGGWCCGMVLIALRKTKKFLFLEIFFQIFLVLVTWLCLSRFGAYSPVITYALENFLYFIVAFIFVRKISWKNL